MKNRGFGVLEGILVACALAAASIFGLKGLREQKKEKEKTKQTRELRIKTNKKTKKTHEALKEIKKGGTHEERKSFFLKFEEMLRGD